MKRRIFSYQVWGTALAAILTCAVTLTAHAVARGQQAAGAGSDQDLIKRLAGAAIPIGFERQVLFQSRLCAPQDFRVIKFRLMITAVLFFMACPFLYLFCKTDKKGQAFLLSMIYGCI